MALIATAALAGCGGGEEDSGSPPGPAERARQAQAKADAEVRAHNEKVQEAYEERQAAEAPAPEQVQATEAATEAYEAPDRLCDFMSAEAQAQTIEYAEASSGIVGQWSCEKANALLVRRAGLASNGKVEVLAVNAQGERATATIQLGNQPATTVPLVREDGEWKLAATATGASE